MRRVGRFLGRAVLVLALICCGLYVFGPYEDDDLNTAFEPRKFGEGVQVYFESTESAFDDITPGTEKRVIWRDGFKEQRTPYSIVYLHGFSASSEEIRPVPDHLAQALDANLVFTRLAGHGRSGDAMADASVQAWMYDTAEALAAGRAVGEKVIVLSTSTGGTLAAAAALDAELSSDVAGIVFISPNFRIKNPLAPLLTWPAARYWLPMLAGAERSFEARKEGQERFWTTRYPSVATMPLAALVQAVRNMDFGQATVPALFWYSPNDGVVSAEETNRIAENWGGAVTVVHPELVEGDDAYSHVVAGDILSPGQTDIAVQGILEWLQSIGIE
ncbi:MAG: alpha/beta hydrolase [Paracoccaceae bacterium]